MAEYISLKTIVLVVRDLYWIGKATYDVVQTARQRDEQLADLQEEYFAEICMVAAFGNLISRLPENIQPEQGLWMPLAFRTYKRLQQIARTDLGRIALARSADYAKFNAMYTDFLLTGPQQLAIENSETWDWTMSGANSAALTAPVNGAYQNWTAGLRDAYSRTRFAIWDKRVFTKYLKALKAHRKILLTFTPMITASHPELAQSFENDQQLRPLGIRGTNRIRELIAVEIDEDAEPKANENALDEVEIHAEHLLEYDLKPQKCEMLSAGTITRRNTREVEDVLIEYKNWRRLGDDRLTKNNKLELQKLVKILSATNPGWFPNTLRLRGYIDQADRDRYALVFEYPDGYLREQPLSLWDLITQGGGIASARVLEARFAMAKQLVMCVARFHADEWVHESICSHSVLVFKDSSSRYLFKEPYLVNFEHSRPSGAPTVLTSSTMTKSGREHYQHPARRSQEPVRFQKEHDLFSLGVVLLEIGLWQTAQQILDRHQTINGAGHAPEISQPKVVKADHDREVFIKSAKDDLPEAMGSSWADAVCSLLRQGDTSQATKPAAETIQQVIADIDFRKLFGEHDFE